jgi:hypothetical protein
MKIAIMQPYLFPYIGYFQLMNAVDIFVFHEDIQYIKGGWINRNRLLLNGEPHLFTFSVQKQSYQENINVRVFADFKRDSESLLRFLQSNYKKAPNYNTVSALLFYIIQFHNGHVSAFDIHTLQCIAEYLGITCHIIKSSDIAKNNELHSQDRVIDIVKALGGDHYINPIGGTELYDEEAFEKQGIKLNFLKADFSRMQYEQFGRPFVPGLSVLDVLMFNPVEKVKEFLSCYDLV